MGFRDIESIQSLVSVFRESERNLALYFPDFETTPPPDDLNRLFGPPVGIDDFEWPIDPQLGTLLAKADELATWAPGDLRMEHVFTIDLRDIRLLGVPEGARAMMLFISNVGGHEAFHLDDRHTAVRFVARDELTRGLYRGVLPRRSVRRWSRRFTLRRIDVPGEVFDPQDDDGSPLARLQRAIARAPARLGGCPLLFREGKCAPADAPAMVGASGTSAADVFLMQFRRDFADVSLGPEDVMYVFRRGAYASSSEQISGPLDLPP